MPKPYPKELHDDVLAVGRQRQAPLTQTAKDFGISARCLSTWIAKVDVEDGNRSGITQVEAAQIWDLKKRNRLLEQENEVLRRASAYVSQAMLPGR